MKPSISRAERFTHEVYSKHKILNKGGIIYSQHLFIAEAIESLRPKKILEIGVQMGCTSAFLLRYLSLTGLSDTVLNSVDIISGWLDPNSGVTHTIGEEVNKHNAPRDNWRLYTQKPVALFSQEIGNDIDMCIIDTSHVYPGEILDFLMALPMLKKGATVFIHDIEIPRQSEYSDVTSMLFSSIPGKKSLPTNNHFSKIRPNIGKVILDCDILDKVLGVFNLLPIKWQQNLHADYLNMLFTYFSKIYNQECMNLYTYACYANTNSDLSKLNYPRCAKCIDNGEKLAYPANPDSSCSNCGSLRSERVLHKICTCMQDKYFNGDILTDTKNYSLPRQTLGQLKNIYDDLETSEQLYTIILNITDTNLAQSKSILQELSSLISQNGVGIIILSDLSSDMTTNDELIIELTSDNPGFFDLYKMKHFEVDPLTETIETVHIITHNNCNLGEILVLKD